MAEIAAMAARADGADRAMVARYRAAMVRADRCPPADRRVLEVPRGRARALVPMRKCSRVMARITTRRVTARAVSELHRTNHCLSEP